MLVKFSKGYSPIIFVLTAVVVVLLIGAAFMLGTHYSKVQDTPNPVTPTIQEMTQETPATNTWLTYEYQNPAPQEEVLPFGKGFKLYYPSSWTITDESRDEKYDHLILWLKNNDGSSIEIAHGEYGAGSCIFKDSANYNSPDLKMATQYEEYTEIENEDFTWRLVNIEGPTYNLCEKQTEGTNTSYSGLNTIGIRNITLQTPTAVTDFEEMIKKVIVYK